MRYSAGGEVRERTGSSPLAFGYGGYLTQAGTEELYAFARTYRPGLARFNEVDPLRSFDAQLGMGSHRYVLGYGNPIRYVDPDGRCGLLAGAAHLIGMGAACDVIDGYMIGTRDPGALREYRMGQVVGVGRSIVEGAVGTAELAGSLAVAGRERLTGEDFGASDQVGAAVAGMVDIASDPSMALALYAEDRIGRFNSAVANELYAEAGEVAGSTQLEVGGAVGGVVGAGRTAAGVAARVARRAPITPRVITEAPSGDIASDIDPGSAAGGSGGGIRYIRSELSPSMVNQELPMSCGAACARQILLDRGTEVDESIVRSLAKVNPDTGARAERIAEALNSLDDQSDYVAGGVMPEQFQALNRTGPWIALLKPRSGPHFVIVDGVRDGNVLVRDPWGFDGPGGNQGIQGVVELPDFLDYWRSGRQQAIFRAGSRK